MQSTRPLRFLSMGLALAAATCLAVAVAPSLPDIVYYGYGVAAVMATFAFGSLLAYDGMASFRRDVAERFAAFVARFDKVVAVILRRQRSGSRAPLFFAPGSWRMCAST